MSKSEKKKVRKIEEISKSSTPEIDEDTIMKIIENDRFIQEKVSLKLGEFKDANDPLFNKLNYSDFEEKILRKKDVEDSDVIFAMKYPKDSKKVFNTFLGFNETSFKCSKRFESELIRTGPLTHSYGDCLIGASRPQTGSNFKAPLITSSAQTYVHHLGVSANSLVEKPFFSKQLLKKLSSSKKGTNQLTLSHLCGNGGCGRPGHIIIESKKNNETRISCHSFLKNCKNKYEIKVIERLCEHNPKCFTNDYNDLSYYYYNIPDKVQS